MRSWWQRMRRSLQRRRNTRTQVRDEVNQSRSEDHVDRQRAGIRDVPPPPGPL